MPILRDAAGGIAPAAVLYWRETTDQQPVETGIQRVTRRLADGLERRGIRPVPVGWDAAGRLMRGAGADAGWLLVPEVPMTALGDGPDPIQLARAYGLRAAALVHDLIPVRLAHLYDAATQELYARYFRMFACADVVLATTELVAGHLRAYLADQGLPMPEIAVVPLPAQFADLPRVTVPAAPRAADAPLRLLAVSTWEPRKNLPGLLRAVGLTRDRTAVPIEVTLVGLRGLYADLDAEIDALLEALLGSAAVPRAGDRELADLYARHHASVYPSCEEGFGMPVLESLWMGRPCLCHAGSAMAEVAPGGGTLMLDMSDADTIAGVLTQLAEKPGGLERLTAETLTRPLRTWDDYARDVVGELWPASFKS